MVLETAVCHRVYSFFFFAQTSFHTTSFWFGSRFLEHHKYWTVVEIHLPNPTVDQNQGGLLVSQGNWGQVQSKFQAVTHLLTLDEAATRLLGMTFVLVACGQCPAHTFCLLAGQAARAATTWQIHAGGWPCFCGTSRLPQKLQGNLTARRKLPLCALLGKCATSRSLKPLGSQTLQDPCSTLWIDQSAK